LKQISGFYGLIKDGVNGEGINKIENREKRIEKNTEKGIYDKEISFSILTSQYSYLKRFQ